MIESSIMLNSDYMRSRLCFDDINNLVANYEKTGDYATDYEINAFLKECGFEVRFGRKWCYYIYFPKIC